MTEILHYSKDPKLWELWHIPSYGQCRIYIINRRVWGRGQGFELQVCVSCQGVPIGP